MKNEHYWLRFLFGMISALLLANYAFAQRDIPKSITLADVIKNSTNAPTSPSGASDIKKLNITISDIVSSNLRIQDVLTLTGGITPIQHLKPQTDVKSGAVNINNILESIGLTGQNGGEAEFTHSYTKSSRANVQNITIVIDAGHGNHDSGAIGILGTQEKDITLLYATKLHFALKQIGYNAVLTRGSDFFIALHNRPEIAESHNADLFISIHADSAPNQNAVGMSVYTLSSSASDDTAQKLADSHDYESIDPNNTGIKHIMIDMSQNISLAKSKLFATTLIHEMQKNNMPMISDHAKSAGFAVLKNPNFPSALIELGFLSNAEEEMLLNTEAYQNKMVYVMSVAINKIFDNN